MTIFIRHDDSGHSISSFYFSILIMIWIILSLIILIPVWILLSPLEFKIDTRVPVIIIQWKSIGNATLLYEDEEWWLKVRVLFFYKQWNLEQMIFADSKKQKTTGQSRRKKSKGKFPWILKFISVLKTFQITQWEIAFSAADNSKNAYWHWLNFLPLTSGHIRINFLDENYLVLTIRNKAWRMAYALIK